MQLNLGGKIRELRRRDERTQEAVAEALGVTPQAVSRWESGGSYPDMEMIPSIANYFGVTIDELFGYHNDREKKIQMILEKADQAIRSNGNHLAKNNGDITETVEMLRMAAEEFPNEPQILIRLGEALHVLGWQKNGASDSDIAYNLQNAYWQEAIQIYEKLLKMELSKEEHGVIVFTLCLLYKRIGEYEKAKTLAGNQDSIVLSKEVLLPKTVEGDERERYQGENIIALLQELYIAVADSVDGKRSTETAAYESSVLAALLNLYETIFCDGNFGDQHRNMRYLYLTLANREAQYGGDIKKAQDYFARGFCHHKAYCSIGEQDEYHYSAPLVSKVIISHEKIFPHDDKFWENWMPGVPKKLYDELRKSERYAECFKSITNH